MVKKSVVFAGILILVVFYGCNLFSDTCIPEYKYLQGIPSWISEVLTSDYFENTESFSDTFKISNDISYSVPVGERSRIIFDDGLKSFLIVPENTEQYKPVLEKIYLGMVYGEKPEVYITETNGVYEFNCNNSSEIKKINSNMNSENTFFQHKVKHIKFEKLADGYNLYLSSQNSETPVLGPIHFTKNN